MTHQDRGSNLSLIVRQPNPLTHPLTFTRSFTLTYTLTWRKNLQGGGGGSVPCAGGGFSLASHTL